MATIILKDADVNLNSVDLSDHVKSVTINLGAEMQDDTAMGDDTRSNKAGLKTWSMDIEFHNDYAGSNVDATLYPLIGADAFPIIVKPLSSAVSTLNPSFTGQAVLESYNPIAGAVGDLEAAPITLQAAGDLTRSVT